MDLITGLGGLFHEYGGEGCFLCQYGVTHVMHGIIPCLQ